MIFQVSLEAIIEVTMELTNNRLLLALSPFPLLLLLVISFEKIQDTLILTKHELAISRVKPSYLSTLKTKETKSN